VSSTHGAGPLREGDALGKYEIVAYLASGGMAELYLARARGIEGFEKIVALKRILPKLADDTDTVTMFLDEARLAATLHHPNLAQVYDIGKEAGSYFFTMEYIHGEDLYTVVQRAAKQKRGLSLSAGLFIATQVAAGLHHAHDKKGADGQPLGTVHRDVSPSNVMIAMDGAVKIVDFGVAKAVARRTKTRSGSIKGKIGYLSPEQARGEEIDRRSDVFAIGILLFELTTGTRLFDKSHDYAVLSQLLTKDAPLPSSRRADYPPQLEEIVLQALSRDPDKRHATAQQLQLAIEEYAREEKLALSSVALGRFMHEIIGDKEDPTARGAKRAATVSAAAFDDPNKSAVTPQTLSGSASRSAIPLERGMPRALGLAAAVLLAIGGFMLVRSWGTTADDPAASAASTTTAAATAAAANATISAVASSATTPMSSAPLPPASASVAVAADTATRPARSRRTASPPTGANTSAAVVDTNNSDGDAKRDWNPGSVLPPIVGGASAKDK